MIGSQPAVVFWHHWPDERLHDLSGPGLGLRKLAREAHAALISDDFWSFVDRLATGRRLVITSDHGYAACGEFHDLAGDQANYMKSVFKSGRSAVKAATDAAFVPPIDLALIIGPRSAPICPGSQQMEKCFGLSDIAARRTFVAGIVRAVP